MQYLPAVRAYQVKSAFRRLKVFWLNAASGAQRPEEAYICIQEARKFGAECSISRLEELSKLKVHSGDRKSSG